MTANDFRNLALSLPETEEHSHMDHPDFRVNGKIFATLGPKELWGMVKLIPEQQASFVRSKPQVFEPVPGGWGRRGATRVNLKAATTAVLRPALIAAWRNTAPKKMLALLDEM